MRYLRRGVLTLSIVCYAAGAWSADGDTASPPPPSVEASRVPALRLLPPGLTLTRPAALALDWRGLGGEVKAFPPAEWAEVGHLVVDYRWLWAYARDLEQVVALREREVALVREQLAVQAAMLASADAGRQQMGDALAAAASVGERDRRAARFERGLLVGAVVLEAAIIAVESGVLVARAAHP